VPGGQTHAPAAFMTFGGGQLFGGGPQFGTVGGQTHCPAAFMTFGGGQLFGGGPQLAAVVPGGQTHWPVVGLRTLGGGHVFGVQTAPAGQMQAPLGPITIGGVHCTCASWTKSDASRSYAPAGIGDIAGAVAAGAAVQSPASARHNAIHFMRILPRWPHPGVDNSHFRQCGILFFQLQICRGRSGAPSHP